MRHRRSDAPEQALPEDHDAHHLAERHPGWLVWWSRRTGKYRARLDLPHSHAPAKIEATDPRELEFHIHQHHELTESIRNLVNKAALA